MKKNDKHLDLPEFDVLVKMAKENPESLEQLRSQMVDQMIDQAPQQYHRKLLGLQFKIDMERKKAKTPMASCIKLSQMMHDSFIELRDALKEAQGSHIEQLRQFNHKGQVSAETRKTQSLKTQEKAKAQQKNAEILEFPG